MLRLTVLLLVLATAPLYAQRPLRVFISADMEGVTGVVTAEQLGPQGFEYQRFREFMTAEVNAAIAGARAAGATHFVVADAHGNGQNLLIERLPADVTVIRSWPRPLGMMEGIDSTFHAAIFIGYHSATTNPAGVRAHTISSARYARVAINGMEAPESTINAAIAGHFGVPVVLISGDDAAVAELQALVPGVEGAIVKRAISFHSAVTLTPEAGQALIRDAATRALRSLGRTRPYRLPPGPVTLDLTFKDYRPSQILEYLSIVERVGSHGIRFVGRDIVECRGSCSSWVGTRRS